MLRLNTITYLVRDYDEAIAWFEHCLAFSLREDTDLGDGKRWVKMAALRGGFSLLLAKAVGADQQSALGKAAGGRVAFFLECDDFEATHARMCAAGVKFRDPPRRESYGTVAVFEDLYGNGWDLIQPTQ
jgi:catechol 2,3-dioxygenase-like lactoylglutathione lyase family enzyme